MDSLREKPIFHQQKLNANERTNKAVRQRVMLALTCSIVVKVFELFDILWGNSCNEKEEEVAYEKKM